MKQGIIMALTVALLLAASCIKEKDTTLEQPQIDILGPTPCDTLYFGNNFRFRLRITDNTGLGNVKMDIHNNFGHHLHGDHEACNLDEPKEAINPYFDEWIFPLPTPITDYVLDTTIAIPDTTNFDSGDYHFHIYVTDDEGYQSFTTLDIKLLQ